MSSELRFDRLSVSIFGESHGAGIGVVLDGLPSGEEIDLERVLRFMARRAPKKDGISTRRNEKDLPEILSGYYNGKTTGTPLCAVIRNTDQHSADYQNLATVARPGHADYTGAIRYRGANDPRGGGHFSGRLTAPLVFAGAVCEQILERRGIASGAHILSIGGIEDDRFDGVSVTRETLERVKAADFPLLNPEREESMKALVREASGRLDSVGGRIECAVVGVRAGIGDPIFDGIENRIAHTVFGIPAVKGLEFGAGFTFAEMNGSKANDVFTTDGSEIRTETNHNGGILGGITNGMPILFTAVIKPTPSIARPQNTVDYIKKEKTVLEIKGRHDACIVPRAVPCIEAAANIAILSYLI
ncbi:MAG: chorismate synthase [Bacteroides sp.]|nr:chorismate synthase [Eubacterium sp.]MCM1418134.1 chorismate synthase [Roseburia sp.]MCM1462241.1 chorismate synthase [Bacteroides sp.]